MRSAPSLLNRIRWWLTDVWAEQDARVVAGLLVLVLLAVGGVAVARAVARASYGGQVRAGVRVVTMRQKVRVIRHGRLVTRWRTRKLYAHAQTVMQTQTIHTPNGTRVVTRPVVRYRVAYRKRVVTENGKTLTVLRGQTITNTRVVTSTREVTDERVTTVTQPVTVVATTTVVSTETRTVPLTVTITVPAAALR